MGFPFASLGEGDRRTRDPGRDTRCLEDKCDSYHLCRQEGDARAG